MTVIADEDCTTAVSSAPNAQPRSLLSVNFESRPDSTPPAFFSSISLISRMPNNSIATPPKNCSTSKTVIEKPPLLSLRSFP